MNDSFDSAIENMLIQDGNFSSTPVDLDSYPYIFGSLGNEIYTVTGQEEHDIWTLIAVADNADISLRISRALNNYDGKEQL